MNRIKRLIIECKCGRKLFDKMDVALSGDSLLVLVAPCECATHQDTRKNFCELHNTNYAVAWLKQRYLKYFGYEIPQTQINVFTPEFLAFCLYIIQEASYLKESHE